MVSNFGYDEITLEKESKVLYCCIHFLVNSNYYLYSLFNLLFLINSIRNK